VLPLNRVINFSGAKANLLLSKDWSLRPVDAVGLVSYVLNWFKSVQTSLIQKKENRKNAPFVHKGNK
jgi:hypothetical protein